MKRKRETETVNRRGRPKICSSDEIPEFFQVYLPEWNSHRLSIPSEFIKHFNGNIPTKVILKDLGGNFWFVDMEEDENAVHFANGWQDFVKESSLQKGEFLVLRYNGSSSFTVRIFGKDACMKDNYLAMEKIATANMKSEAASEIESKAASTDTQNSPKVPEKSRGSFQISGHKKSRKRPMNRRFSLPVVDVKIEDGALKAAYELMSSSKHPTFKIIMPQTCLERNYMHIHPRFVKRHMKKDTKRVELLIENKSWPVNLTSPQRNREEKDEFFHATEIGLLKKVYDQSSEDEKKVLLRKIKDIITLSTTSFKEPTPVIPKGRPRSSKKKLSQKEKKHEVSTKRDSSDFEYAKTIEEQQLVAIQLSQVSKRRKQAVKKKNEVDRRKWEFEAYMQFIPEFMHPFIEDIQDVPSDGHCGFRCIAEHMGWFDDRQGWESVRIDLIKDLKMYKKKYEGAWGSWYYHNCFKALNFFKSECKTADHWMIMPDMGFLIASAYNSVVFFYSQVQCLTFFPHARPPPQGKQFRQMAIALVNGNHFVKLFLKDGAPLPYVATKWKTLRNEESSAWILHFADRIKLFEDLSSCGVRKKDSPIIIN